ncbi:FNIP repeat protein [Chlorella virus XW01]|nr:FNIP repeat protein [Chlorella virus XW01]
MDTDNFFYINSTTDKIPDNIQKVYLNDSEESIKDLPNHITHLKLKHCKEIINLPNNLKCLEFDKHSTYNEPLTNLPEDLTHLFIPHSYNHQLIYNENIEKPTIYNEYKLPEKLEEITLVGHNNEDGFFKKYKYVEDLLTYCNNKNIKLISKITNNNIFGRLHEEVLNEKITNREYLNDDGTIKKNKLKEYQNKNLYMKVLNKNLYN